MSNFSIGISGLAAAQNAMDIIGNNMANAATEGYHRQRIHLTPAYSSQYGSTLLGGGVEFNSITRMIDTLLEQEILRQNSSLEQLNQEYGTLRTIENAMGEFSAGGGMGAVIDKFFIALDELSAHTDEIIWQKQAVSSAETMAGQFRTLGEYLGNLEDQLRLETENAIDEINTLTTQIAQLNTHIERSETVSGSQANNIRDQRDQLVSQLSRLIDVETQNQAYGVVNIMVSGIPVVVGAHSTQLTVGTTENNEVGIAVSGTYNYSTSIQGGKVGGLLSLRNTILSDIQDNLDTLANTMVQQINQRHVQGVGSEGSFTSLSGWAMTSNNLSEITPTISNGSFFIRVTNTATGAITRNEIIISDTSTDTLTSVAAAISGITGVSASVQSSKFVIAADTNYKFDFIPSVLPQPSASTLTGSPPTISVSGIYNGTTNQTFTCEVIGTGSVGNGNLQLQVKDGSGSTIQTFDVGSGYAAGDKLDFGNGIKISLSTGDLNNTETFKVDAFADTDTANFLSAVGLNTFFSGTTASDIAVCSDITLAPGRIATSLGQDMNDNENTLLLAGVGSEVLSGLGSMTPGNYYRNIVTDVAQQVSIKEMRVGNLEEVMKNLVNQRGEVSGVNINDEAALLLVYEQMFQAMAKYISTVQLSIQAIINMI